MRDLLLVVILFCALPKAVRHTYVAVNLWTWVSLMNPHRLTYGFAFSTPFAAIAAGAALISLVLTKDKLSMPKERPVTFLILFVTWMCVTTATSIYPEESLVQLKKIFKIQIMTFVALAAVQERKHIQLFTWINVLSIGFFGLKGGIFTVLTGGGARVWGPPGSFIEDNNELGTALIVTIPLMNYLRLTSANKWARHGLLALMLLSAIAALGTQSRGALLALGAMGFVLWLRTERKLLSGISIALIGMLLIGFMPSTWEARMNTIQDYQNDGSAMGRINAWKLAINIANHRITGAGYEAYTPETFALYAPNPLDIHVAHSIYFSVMAEHGYIGLFLFLGIWLSTLGIAKRIRKETRHDKELLWLFNLAGMCQVALIGYAVGGAFLSLAYFDLPYNIMVILVVAWRWLKNYRKNAESTELIGKPQTV